MNHCNKCGYTGELVDHPGCDYGAQKMSVPPSPIERAIERAIDYCRDPEDDEAAAAVENLRTMLASIVEAHNTKSHLLESLIAEAEHNPEYK